MNQVKIVVTGYDFEPAEFTASEVNVVRASGYLREALDASPINPVNGLKEIGFSEYDSEVNRNSLFGAFNPSTMRRFVQFAENSDIVEQNEQLAHKFNRLKQERDDDIDRYVANLEKRRQERIDGLQKFLKGEQRTIVNQMRRIRDESLERIRLMFDAHCFVSICDTRSS